MKSKINSFINNNKYILLSGVAALFIITMVYFCYSIIPFGDKTILRMDLYHQYGPLFAELYERTGIQFNKFNTIYQLYADKLDGRLEGVTDFLMIPEYLMYKLLDNIMLVCRDEEHYKSSDAMQAYLVDPSNKKQLKSAQDWATWTDYGPRVKTESGRWESEWEKKHEPIEYTFGNQHFKLELLDCAGGSSQGGKLSFWNCIVSKDDKNCAVVRVDDDTLVFLKGHFENTGFPFNGR